MKGQGARVCEPRMKGRGARVRKLRMGGLAQIFFASGFGAEEYPESRLNLPIKKRRGFPRRHDRTPQAERRHFLANASRLSLFGFERALDERNKAVRLERRSAYEPAVDVFFGKERVRIFGLHGAAV